MNILKMNVSENHTFEKIDFTKETLGQEYESCVFSQCNFVGANLSNVKFSECEFVNCNMSNVIVTNAALRDVRFRDCKLMGIGFGNCDSFLFSVSFEKCVLDLSSFHRLKMRKTKFTACSLHEASFVETDLGESVFDECDFSQALFERTILEKADFRTSYNYIINPETNKIKKAKFAQSGIAGLLQGYDITIE